MINDLQLAKDFSSSYNEHKKQSDLTIDFTCQVLTTANWPSYKLMKVNIPIQLEQNFQNFRSFYESKNIKRSLTLCFSLGQAIVSMQIQGRPKPHELVVSTIGMVILLLFNDS